MNAHANLLAMICLSIAMFTSAVGPVCAQNTVDSIEQSEQGDQQFHDEGTVTQPSSPEGGRDLRKDRNGDHFRPRFALTLAGGGGPCAAHIGVLKALEANGLRPDFVSGSSMGAVIGGMYASGVPVHQLEQMALEGDIEKAFFPVSPKVKAATWVPTYLLKRLIGLKPPIGLYSGKSISKFINAKIPIASKRIEDFPIKFAAVAVDLQNTKPFWITKGNIGEAVRASATLPLLYQPVETKDRTLVDGGIRSVLPTEVARSSAAPVIVGARLYSKLEARKGRKFRTFGSYYERVTNITLSEIEAKSISDADFIIEPDLGHMREGKLTRETVAKMIRAGEAATLKLIPKIKEKLQASQAASAQSTDNALNAPVF